MERCKRIGKITPSPLLQPPHVRTRCADPTVLFKIPVYTLGAAFIYQQICLCRKPVHCLESDGIRTINNVSVRALIRSLHNEKAGAASCENLLEKA